MDISVRNWMKITSSIIVQRGDSECQDRAEIIPVRERTVLALADGAGGVSGGARAAEAFIALVREQADKLLSAEDCVHLVSRADQELSRNRECGETTGIVAIVDSNRIFGASVGDSAVCLFTEDGIGELTYGQQRKPLLGSGEAPVPRGFNWPIEEGTLVVASDGLWKYTTSQAIHSRVRTRGETDLAVRLVELVRHPSGGFPDDVAIITCRIELRK